MPLYLVPLYMVEPSFLFLASEALAEIAKDRRRTHLFHNLGFATVMAGCWISQCVIDIDVLGHSMNLGLAKLFLLRLLPAAILLIVTIAPWKQPLPRRKRRRHHVVCHIVVSVLFLISIILFLYSFQDYLDERVFEIEKAGL